jgi:hypothetical protein
MLGSMDASILSATTVPSCLSTHLGSKSPFADRPLKAGPELQIGVMQLARERSPPRGLRLTQTELSRKSN